MVTEIVRGASVVLVGRMVGMVTRGALVVLLTRYLFEPTEYGLLFLGISVLSVAMLFGNLGFSKAGSRYIAEYRTTAPELVSVVVNRTLLFNGLALAVVCLAVALFDEPIASLVGEPGIAPLLLVGTTYVVFKSLKGSCVTFFQGFNMMRWVAVLGIVTNLLLLVAVPAFVVLGYGIEGAVVGYALGYALASTVGLVVIYRRLDTTERPGREEVRAVSSRILRYSVPLTMTKGANTLDSRADTILLGVFRGPTAIAFYALGKQLADFLIAPAQSLGFAISPTYGEEKADDNLDRAARLYEQSFVYTVACYGPAAAGIVFVATPTVELVFGADYAGAGPVLQIFSVFVFVRAIDKITNDALDFLGRARARAVAKGVLALTNVALNVVLIPMYGAIGATVATVVTYTALVVVELYVITDELPVDTVHLGRQSLVVLGIVVGMSAVVYPLSLAITDLLSLAAVVAAGVVVWVALTARTNVVDLGRIRSAFT